MTVRHQIETERARLEALHALERMIVRMAEQIEAKARLAEEQARALEHSRRIFDRASAMAKLGVWECELNGETLTWTNGVYDMFELPRGFRITREEILGFYSEESRRQLEDIRSRAIREGHGFTLDAKIVTAMGKERWMRITADIEHENGVPVRIFGMKQDITEDQVRRAAGRL